MCGGKLNSHELKKAVLLNKQLMTRFIEMRLGRLLWRLIIRKAVWKTIGNAKLWHRLLVYHLFLLMQIVHLYLFYLKSNSFFGSIQQRIHFINKTVTISTNDFMHRWQQIFVRQISIHKSYLQITTLVYTSFPMFTTVYLIVSMPSYWKKYTFALYKF